MAADLQLLVGVDDQPVTAPGGAEGGGVAVENDGAGDVAVGHPVAVPGPRQGTGKPGVQGVGLLQQAVRGHGQPAGHPGAGGEGHTRRVGDLQAVETGLVDAGVGERDRLRRISVQHHGGSAGVEGGGAAAIGRRLREIAANVQNAVCQHVGAAGAALVVGAGEGEIAVDEHRIRGPGHHQAGAGAVAEVDGQIAVDGQGVAVDLQQVAGTDDQLLARQDRAQGGKVGLQDDGPGDVAVDHVVARPAPRQGTGKPGVQGARLVEHPGGGHDQGTGHPDVAGEGHPAGAADLQAVKMGLAGAGRLEGDRLRHIPVQDHGGARGVEGGGAAGIARRLGKIPPEVQNAAGQHVGAAGAAVVAGADEGNVAVDEHGVTGLGHHQSGAGGVAKIDGQVAVNRQAMAVDHQPVTGVDDQIVAAPGGAQGGGVAAQGDGAGDVAVDHLIAIPGSRQGAGEPGVQVGSLLQQAAAGHGQPAGHPGIGGQGDPGGVGDIQVEKVRLVGGGGLETDRLGGGAVQDHPGAGGGEPLVAAGIAHGLTEIAPDVQVAGGQAGGAVGQAVVAGIGEGDTAVDDRPVRSLGHHQAGGGAVAHGDGQAGRLQGVAVQGQGAVGVDGQQAGGMQVAGEGGVAADGQVGHRAAHGGAGPGQAHGAAAGDRAQGHQVAGEGQGAPGGVQGGAGLHVEILERHVGRQQRPVRRGQGHQDAGRSPRRRRPVGGGGPAGGGSGIPAQPAAVEDEHRDRSAAADTGGAIVQGIVEAVQAGESGLRGIDQDAVAAQGGHRAVCALGERAEGGRVVRIDVVGHHRDGDAVALAGHHPVGHGGQAVVHRMDGQDRRRHGDAEGGAATVAGGVDAALAVAAHGPVPGPVGDLDRAVVVFGGHEADPGAGFQQGGGALGDGAEVAPGHPVVQGILPGAEVARQAGDGDALKGVGVHVGDGAADQVGDQGAGVVGAGHILVDGGQVRRGGGVQDRGIIGGGDGQGDGGAVAVAQVVGDGVGEGIAAVMVLVRQIGEGAVAVVGHRAVRPLGEGGDGEVGSAPLPVVGQDIAGDKRHVLGGAEGVADGLGGLLHHQPRPGQEQRLAVFVTGKGRPIDALGAGREPVAMDHHRITAVAGHHQGVGAVRQGDQVQGGEDELVVAAATEVNPQDVLQHPVRGGRQVHLDAAAGDEQVAAVDGQAARAENRRRALYEQVTGDEGRGVEGDPRLVVQDEAAEVRAVVGAILEGDGLHRGAVQNHGGAGGDEPPATAGAGRGLDEIPPEVQGAVGQVAGAVGVERAVDGGEGGITGDDHLVRGAVEHQTGVGAVVHGQQQIAVHGQQAAVHPQGRAGGDGEMVGRQGMAVQAEHMAAIDEQIAAIGQQQVTGQGHGAGDMAVDHLIPCRNLRKLRGEIGVVASGLLEHPGPGQAQPAGDGKVAGQGHPGGVADLQVVKTGGGQTRILEGDGLGGGTVEDHPGAGGGEPPATAEIFRPLMKIPADAQGACGQPVGAVGSARAVDGDEAEIPGHGHRVTGPGHAQPRTGGAVQAQGEVAADGQGVAANLQGRPPGDGEIPHPQGIAVHRQGGVGIQKQVAVLGNGGVLPEAGGTGQVGVGHPVPGGDLRKGVGKGGVEVGGLAQDAAVDEGQLAADHHVGTEGHPGGVADQQIVKAGGGGARIREGDGLGGGTVQDHPGAVGDEPLAAARRGGSLAEVAAHGQGAGGKISGTVGGSGAVGGAEGGVARDDHRRRGVTEHQAAARSIIQGHRQVAVHGHGAAGHRQRRGAGQGQMVDIEGVPARAEAGPAVHEQVAVTGIGCLTQGDGSGDMGVAHPVTGGHLREFGGEIGVQRTGLIEDGTVAHEQPTGDMDIAGQDDADLVVDFQVVKTGAGGAGIFKGDGLGDVALQDHPGAGGDKAAARGTGAGNLGKITKQMQRAVGQGAGAVGETGPVRRDEQGVSADGDLIVGVGQNQSAARIANRYGEIVQNRQLLSIDIQSSARGDFQVAVGSEGVIEYGCALDGQMRGDAV